MSIIQYYAIPAVLRTQPSSQGSNSEIKKSVDIYFFPVPNTDPLEIEVRDSVLHQLNQQQTQSNTQPPSTHHNNQNNHRMDKASQPDLLNPVTQTDFGGIDIEKERDSEKEREEKNSIFSLLFRRTPSKERLKRAWYLYLWRLRTSKEPSFYHFTNLTFQTFISLSSPQQNFLTSLPLSSASSPSTSISNTSPTSSSSTVASNLPTIIEIHYPTTISLSKIQSSYADHHSSDLLNYSFFWLLINILFLPLTIFLALIPAIPSVPLFFNVFRIYIYSLSCAQIFRLRNLKSRNLEFFHSSLADYYLFLSLRSSLSSPSPSSGSFEVHFIPTEKLNLELNYREMVSTTTERDRERELYLTSESREKLKEVIGELQVEDFLRNTYSYLQRKTEGVSSLSFLYSSLNPSFVLLFNHNCSAFYHRFISSSSSSSSSSDQRSSSASSSSLSSTSEQPSSSLFAPTSPPTLSPSSSLSELSEVRSSTEMSETDSRDQIPIARKMK